MVSRAVPNIKFMLHEPSGTVVNVLSHLAH
jgi:hypothetical protein